jgi:hypothetical protein
MSIPYNINLSWKNYIDNPNWDSPNWDSPNWALAETVASETCPAKRAINELFVKTFRQFFVRGEQFIRDTIRLVVKVPFRSLCTPIFLPKNWKERQRASINVKLAGYSFVQLLFVPVKFAVALVALVSSGISHKTANELLNKSDDWTADLDGRASQLEALKEEGRVNAKDKEE